jgi:membrane protein DedA with SNARE-associated domain
VADPTITRADAPAAGPSKVSTTLTREERKTTRLCLTVLGVLGTGSMLGVAFSLYLVNHHPLLLIAISPLGRHLILVAPIVDPGAFLAVVVGRRLLFYLASFHLGRALGPLGIPWIEARAARFGRFVRWMERLFAKAPHAVVLLMSGPTVSILAGISGMRAAAFVPLATLSLVLRALLVLGLAAWIQEYIEIALVWIDEYWVPGTVLMVALVGVYRWRRRDPSPVIED